MGNERKEMSGNEMGVGTTPSQTIGPFFRIGLAPLYDGDLAKNALRGGRVTIRGRLLDGKGQAVPDAVLEIWQANAEGKYAHANDLQNKNSRDEFTGFGRVPTEENGEFLFTTIKPGAVAAPDGREQAPHLVISIFMRGLLKGLLTRMYFPDDPRNPDDFILSLVPSERRSSLIARKVAAEDRRLEWNVILQGNNETVFFDC
jgi:protocatechuate 3,4-dioxygenase alpha subunit